MGQLNFTDELSATKCFQFCVFSWVLTLDFTIISCRNAFMFHNCHIYAKYGSSLSNFLFFLKTFVCPSSYNLLSKLFSFILHLLSWIKICLAYIMSMIHTVKCMRLCQNTLCLNTFPKMPTKTSLLNKTFQQSKTLVLTRIFHLSKIFL